MLSLGEGIRIRDTRGNTGENRGGSSMTKDESKGRAKLGPAL